MGDNQKEIDFAAENANLRPINCELNPLSRSDGSALFAQGKTSVLASMLGPIEVNTKNLKIDKAHVECIFRAQMGVPASTDKLREAIIKDACESALLTQMHPRTMFSIQVQELDNRGGLDACSINAACLALLIGGAPMKYTLAAINCILTKNDKLIVDPDQCQMLASRTSFLFVFDSLEKRLVAIHTSGCCTKDQFNEAELLCRNASKTLFQFYRTILGRFHNRLLFPKSDKKASEAKQTEQSESTEA